MKTNTISAICRPSSRDASFDFTVTLKCTKGAGTMNERLLYLKMTLMERRFNKNQDLDTVMNHTLNYGLTTITDSEMVKYMNAHDGRKWVQLVTNSIANDPKGDVLKKVNRFLERRDSNFKMTNYFGTAPIYSWKLERK